MMVMIQEMPIEQRPREKAFLHGIRVLSDRELLALVLRHGYAGKSSLQVADELLYQAKGIEHLEDYRLHDFMKIDGIKQAKALQLLACFEIARRISYQRCQKQDILNCPDEVVRWLNHEIGHQNQEMFLVIYLNLQNHILRYEILFIGTVNYSVVHPREIFKVAVECSCSRIMLVHNHPSGSLAPSLADMELTRQIQQAGQLMRIDVVDHLIVNGSESFSFCHAGLLERNEDSDSGSMKQIKGRKGKKTVKKTV